MASKSDTLAPDKRHGSSLSWHSSSDENKSTLKESIIGNMTFLAWDPNCGMTCLLCILTQALQDLVGLIRRMAQMLDSGNVN
jgi:hypothetical protein